ncbi:hypothetical protein [Magnetospirillum sp. 15-1]|uniref:hypothetical protein n=1 Tax=Magnetospirillum sp. 15-1 TaxID=1979370 RepID=UPI0011419ADB|nr:hypothetical protein [Magnetospirillum sp. 15-1]
MSLRPNPFPVLGENLFGNQTGKETSGNGTTSGENNGPALGRDGNNQNIIGKINDSEKLKEAKDRVQREEAVVNANRYLDTIVTGDTVKLSDSQQRDMTNIVNSLIVSNSINEALDTFHKIDESAQLKVLDAFSASATDAIKNLIVGKFRDAIIEAVGNGVADNAGTDTLKIRDLSDAINSAVAASTSNERADKLAAVASAINLLSDTVPLLGQLSDAISLAIDISRGTQSRIDSRDEAIVNTMHLLQSDPAYAGKISQLTGIDFNSVTVQFN